MNIKYLILPAIVLGDILTKTSDHFTQADHYKTMHWWFLLFLIPLLNSARRNKDYLLPALIMVTGGLLNYIDSLNSVVINPFILIVLQNAIGFNLADVALFSGLAWCVFIAYNERKAKKVEKLKRQRAEKVIEGVEWKNA